MHILRTCNQAVAPRCPQKEKISSLQEDKKRWSTLEEKTINPRIRIWHFGIANRSRTCIACAGRAEKKGRPTVAGRPAGNRSDRRRSQATHGTRPEPDRDRLPRTPELLSSGVRAGANTGHGNAGARPGLENRPARLIGSLLPINRPDHPLCCSAAEP